jgi:hypothetical protein
MPANVVKTKRDERLWNEAKAQVRKEYPGVAEDSDRFYRLVNGIYQRMKARVGGGTMAKAATQQEEKHMITKTENGVEYPAAAYAYVPDPKQPSTWKLRLWETPKLKETPRQVGRAMAALGPGGFRGNRVEIPAGDLAAVRAKVRAAWKRVHGGEGQKAPAVLGKNVSVDGAGYILFGKLRA